MSAVNQALDVFTMLQKKRKSAHNMKHTEKQTLVEIYPLYILSFMQAYTFQAYNLGLCGKPVALDSIIKLHCARKPLPSLVEHGRPVVLVFRKLLEQPILKRHTKMTEAMVDFLPDLYTVPEDQSVIFLDPKTCKSSYIYILFSY